MFGTYRWIAPPKVSRLEFKYEETNLEKEVLATMVWSYFVMEEVMFSSLTGAKGFKNEG
jgi:hypothetical protein